MPEVLTVMRDSGMGMLGEQADGGDEVGVVEEGLAHAHEDEVDAGGGGVAAGAADVDVVAVEDGGDLAGDLAGGEVAADAEFGGETELAVDGAADLAGDADGGAAVGEGGFAGVCGVFDVVGFLFFGGLRAVAAFAAVAVGHPDGFDGLAVGHADEVALGAVDGAGGLDDLGQADGVALGGEGIAEGLRQGGDLVERGNSLAVEGVVKLRGAIGLLAQALHEGGELGQGEAEERFHFN